MTATQMTPSSTRDWHAVVSEPEPCFEWTGFGTAVAALGSRADTPGRAARAGDGRLQSLHFAPDRWLVVSPEAHTVARLEAAELAGEGVLTSVAGKWQRLRIGGGAAAAPGAGPLQAAFAQEQLLAGRDCAALWIFDCPVIAVRDGDDLDLYVEASYTASLFAVIARLGIGRGG